MIFLYRRGLSADDVHNGERGNLTPNPFPYGKGNNRARWELSRGDCERFKESKMKKFAARFLFLAILLAIALVGIQIATAAPAADQTYALTRTIKVGGDG